MWKSFYEGSSLLDLPLLAMGIFMATFAVAVTYAILKNGKEDPKARLPLDDDNSALGSKT